MVLQIKLKKMVDWLQLNEDERRIIIAQVSFQTGMSEKAIEKDRWVTLALQAIFTLPMRQHFIFKGGTSLSKGWKLIQRFSEDIDIALAPEAFGETYLREPTHTYVKRLKKKGCAYTSTVIKDALETQLLALGIPAGLIIIEAEPVQPLIPDKDPQTLYIRYPSLFDPNPYIAETVKIEFSVRSLREPFKDVLVQSIIREHFQGDAYIETPFIVPATLPQKTFIEKMMLLHEKLSALQAEEMGGERQSRHLADLGSMLQQGIAQQVLNDPDLYATLLHHRRYYVRLKNVDYSKMQIHELSFIPPPPIIEQFRRNYEILRTEMIYGVSPDFETLIDQMRELHTMLSSASVR